MSSHRDYTGRDYTAVAVALDDQHGALLRDELAEQIDVLAHLAASRYPRRPSRALLQRYAAELLHRGMRTCQHLGPGGGGPAWAVADDLALRCADCTQHHLRRPAPLPAGCDLCAGPGELKAVAVVAAPIPVRSVGGDPYRTPAAIVIGGVCADCWSAGPRDTGTGTA